jgi:hypothetical protein
MCCGYVGYGGCLRWVGCDVALVEIGVWGMGGVGWKGYVAWRRFWMGVWDLVRYAVLGGVSVEG